MSSEPLCLEGALGITAENLAIDFAKKLEWKDGIVNRLNSGVAGLLKRSRVRMFHGQARFLDGKTVLVETDTGRQTIHAENIVIATGSVPVEIQSLQLLILEIIECEVAPRAGFEPATNRLTAGCSTAELPGNRCSLRQRGGV